MKFRLHAVIVSVLALALPLSANAQSCTTTNLADLGACAFSAAEECRAAYPTCTSDAQKLGQVITQQDILNSIVDVCCVDTKTAKQQKSCIKSKSNPLIIRLNLLKAVASTPFKYAIAKAISNVKEIKREGCGSGTIVD